MQRGETGRGPHPDHGCLSEAGAVKLDCCPLSTFDPGGRSWEKQRKSEPREVHRRPRDARHVVAGETG